MARAITWLFNEMGWELFLCSLPLVVVCLGVPLSLSVPPMGGLALICACTGLTWGFGPPPKTGQLQLSPSPCPHIIPWEACVCVPKSGLAQEIIQPRAHFSLMS